MSSCKSADNPTMSFSKTEVKDLQRKIINKMDKYKVSSSRVVKTAQNITIEQSDGSSIASSPIYQEKKIERNFLGIKTGECPQYGCAYSVNQTAKVELYTVNSAIVNESENIWSEVSSKVKASSDTSAGGGGISANSTTDEARDDAISAIETELMSLSEEVFSDDNNTVIKLTSPVVCEGPCNNQRGPIINQQAYFTIKADNIINKTLEIIEKKKRTHSAQSKVKVKKDNTECITELLISASSCLCSLMVLYMASKMI